ncbi:MAG: MaoC like domain [Actinomycetia bacterium]|nr:MaoC like domain [Actinomycetes bacterium]
MNSDGTDFAALAIGQQLGPLPLTVSAAGNVRYWNAAGVDAAPLRAGALYPPIAANLTVLLLQTATSSPVLQVGQRIVNRRVVKADTPLVVEGLVTERFARKGREYAVVHAAIRTDEPGGGQPLWASVATFCDPVRRTVEPDAALTDLTGTGIHRSDPATDPAANRYRGDWGTTSTPPPLATTTCRSLELTPDRIRAYSRSGNFHSDAEAARNAGLTRPVAQGMHLLGPAYGILLEQWGSEFLELGALEAQFVAMTFEGTTVDVTVHVGVEEAVIEVHDQPDGELLATGAAWRVAPTD